ncbi:MAG: hypothetical protein JJE05_10525 [Actinobacteria bacterium]|nr:hypothetical protein [Actinomycetota bacterium]
MIDRAAEGQASYQLSNFRIEHPYVRAGEWTTPTTEVAAVYFDIQFTTGDFPGPTECALELYDKDGAVVGSATTVLNVLDPAESNRNGGVPVAIETSGTPTAAQGHCAAGTYEKGPGYAFEFLGKRDVPEDYPQDRVELVFSSRWIDDAQPGWRSCALEVSYTDGTKEKLAPFTLVVGEPNAEVVQTPVIPESKTVGDAELVCAVVGS